MKRTIIIALALFLQVIPSFAQFVESVETSDGSIYDGYISEQIPGKQLSVYAELAKLVFPTDSVSDVHENLRKFSSFGESGKSWLLRENVDTGHVVLSSFMCGNVFWDDVKVLNQSGRQMTVVCLRPRTFVIDWEDVAVIRKKRADDVPYGLRDVVTLVSGKQMTGQIVEQVMGKHIVVLDEKGEKHVANVEDILSTRSERIDMDAPVLQQTVLLDRLVFDGDTAVCGHVDSKVMKFGKSISILALPDGMEQSYRMADVRKYQKYPNPDFIPYVKPAVDTAKVIKVNGDMVKFSEICCSGSRAYVMDPCAVSVKVGSEVKVELKNISCDSKASLFKTSEEKFKAGDKGDERDGNKYPAYDLSSWPRYECSIDSDGNDGCAVAFVMKEAGVFFLRLDKDGNGFIVEAEK